MFHSFSTNSVSDIFHALPLEALSLSLFDWKLRTKVFGPALLMVIPFISGQDEVRMLLMAWLVNLLFEIILPASSWSSPVPWVRGLSFTTGSSQLHARVFNTNSEIVWEVR